MAPKKILDNSILIIVGLLFIFSGLIKVNDPVGTAIKLQEYFEVFSTDFASFFHVFIPYALALSVFLVVLEVILGVAVIFRYRMKITGWVLLILIVFFTFLTFYSAYFNKVTDCGCFGDAIKLTPWQSFGKDLILLVLIIYIFVNRKKYLNFFNKKLSDIIMSIATALIVFLAIFAINHLPYIDFRPYKIGNNIKEEMQSKEPFRYKYIMEKNGETFEFEKYPTDTTYQFKEMVLLNPEAQPTITDYNIWTDEGDFTDESLTGKKLFVVYQDVNEASLSNLDKIKELINNLEGQLNTWIITSSNVASVENFRHEYQLAVPYYFADATVLKAMIRSNPGIILLNNGTVLGKWHFNDTPSPKEVLDLIKK